MGYGRVFADRERGSGWDLGRMCGGCFWDVARSFADRL